MSESKITKIRYNGVDITPNVIVENGVIIYDIVTNPYMDVMADLINKINELTTKVNQLIALQPSGNN